MYIINEKGEKVKSKFFATDILSKIIREEDSPISECEVKTNFEDLLNQNGIFPEDLELEWKKLKSLVCQEINTNGSYQITTSIVDGLCTVTNTGVMYLPQVQVIVKFLLGKSIDWFCKT